MRQLSNVVQRKINFSNSKSFSSLYARRVNGSIKFQGLGSRFRAGSVLSWRPLSSCSHLDTSYYVYGRLRNGSFYKEMERILFMQRGEFCKQFNKRLIPTYACTNLHRLHSRVFVGLELTSTLHWRSKVNYYREQKPHNPTKAPEALWDVVCVFCLLASVVNFYALSFSQTHPFKAHFILTVSKLPEKCWEVIY